MGNKDPLYAECVAAENKVKAAAVTKAVNAVQAKRDKDLAIFAKRYRHGKAYIADVASKDHNTEAARKSREVLDASYAKDVKVVNEAFEKAREERK